jgi:hypothetical protein
MKTRTPLAPHDPIRPTEATCATALHLFRALGALHQLADHDADLLWRATAGLRFIRSTSTFTASDDALFRIALADLDDCDALVVETAARYAADLVPAPRHSFGGGGGGAERRAMWLTAILRLADAACPAGSAGANGVYATWTDSALYLEFDGRDITPALLGRAAGRVSALEAITGRRIVLANSSARRGAA